MRHFLRCALTTALVVLSGATQVSRAAIIPLSNATATFSQTSFASFSVSQAIDGDFSGFNGWAIYEGLPGNQPGELGFTNEQTAVFETTADAGFVQGTALTFTLSQLFTAAPGHTIGRFRLAATTDPRSQFADGLQTAGDVTANWTILAPLSATATSGTTLTVLEDDSILASGDATTSVYTVNALTSLTGITGFRLEVLTDDSLPDTGPGRYPLVGNFVLTEFEVEAQAIPEPSCSALVGITLLAGRASRRWRGSTARRAAVT